MAQSTPQAKYISPCDDVNQAIRIRKIMSDIGEAQGGATIIYCDKMIAILRMKSSWSRVMEKSWSRLMEKISWMIYSPNPFQKVDLKSFEAYLECRPKVSRSVT